MHHQQRRRTLGVTQPGEHAVALVVADQPLETLGAIIAQVEGRFFAVVAVQLAHQGLHGEMLRVAQQVPVQLLVVVPFAPLAELAAHEQQLLARMGPHEGQVQAQVGKLLPAVAGHLAEQRALAVHHLVMGDRQDEMLGEGIEQAEGQLVMMVFAVDGLFLDIGQAVVHPAHVPLVGETEPALARGVADARPGGRFFGYHQGAGHFGMHHLIEVAEELDGLQVLPPAVAVGYPFVVLARVVAVEHRGHRIHAQPVHVVDPQPVQRRSQHEAVHLGPAEVVDEGVPVLVEALEGVRVLVERGAVEAAQAMFVGGKVRRHPVEDHADARAVAGVDEGGEIRRAAMPRGRGEQR
ncbi:hypothetical protein D3C85_1022530 [compost metagenome]